jgi:hypothetical protein
MASGHVNRVKRPNTWLHRPMLQNVKKSLLTRSRPHMTHSGHIEIKTDRNGRDEKHCGSTTEVRLSP